SLLLTYSKSTANHIKKIFLLLQKDILTKNITDNLMDSCVDAIYDDLGSKNNKAKFKKIIKKVLFDSGIKLNEISSEEDLKIVEEIISCVSKLKKNAIFKKGVEVINKRLDAEKKQKIKINPKFNIM
ncbi:hypothetical protein N9L02_03725, partial [Gammaproteobacteria bacterium]|nr:hypothetical protein [Gammaproteobacteria bacterium]